MIDKYKSAVLEYERCRVSIIDLTKDIGIVCALSCGNTKGDGLFSTSCIDRLWAYNKEYRRAVEDETPIKECVDRGELCGRCEEINKIVATRKVARKNFGIAKRRIGQLARGLIFKLTKED